MAAALNIEPRFVVPCQCLVSASAESMLQRCPASVLPARPSASRLFPHPAASCVFCATAMPCRATGLQGLQGQCCCGCHWGHVHLCQHLRLQRLGQGLLRRQHLQWPEAQPDICCQPGPGLPRVQVSACWAVPAPALVEDDGAAVFGADSGFSLRQFFSCPVTQPPNHPAPCRISQVWARLHGHEGRHCHQHPGHFRPVPLVVHWQQFAAGATHRQVPSSPRLPR